MMKMQEEVEQQVESENRRQQLYDAQKRSPRYAAGRHAGTRKATENVTGTTIGKQSVVSAQSLFHRFSIVFLLGFIGIRANARSFPDRFIENPFYCLH